MKTEFDEYTRIGKGFLGMSSLWLGNDHLLYIKGSGLFLPFREEYRRFRYQDIHAVSTVRTGGMWGYGILLLFGLVIFSLITYAILADRDPGSNVGLIWTLALPLPLGLLCFIFLVRNFILGPRCVCELQTALKRERIGPLSRAIKAEQVLAVLEERIFEHQETARAEIPGNAELAAVETKPRPQFVPKIAPIGLAVSAMTGLLILLGIHVESVIVVVALLVGMLGSILLTLGCLITSERNPCPDRFRAILWILLGTLFSITGTALVYYAVAAFDDPSFAIDASGPLDAFAAFASSANLVFYLIFLTLGIVMVGSSLIGLFISNRFRKSSRHEAIAE